MSVRALERIVEQGVASGSAAPLCSFGAARHPTGTAVPPAWRNRLTVALRRLTPWDGGFLASRLCSSTL